MTPIAQAGAIAVREREGRHEFLLVTAKRSPSEWILPKGGIEPGESPEAAALRELLEEAGYEGTILAPVGSAEFDGRRGRVRTEYFLVQAGRRSGPGEDRTRRWLLLDDARRLISHDDARRLLDAAAGILQKTPPPA
jgi:8-oxo-dGTP pyrophosphatase MutT (NUDIX family)